MAYILHIPPAFSNWFPFVFLQCLSLEKIKTKFKNNYCSNTSQKNVVFLYLPLSKFLMTAEEGKFRYEDATDVFQPLNCYTFLLLHSKRQLAVCSLASQVPWSCIPHRHHHHYHSNSHSSSPGLCGRGSLLPPDHQLLLISSRSEISVISNPLFKIAKKR